MEPKHESIEIDLNEMSKEELINLIDYAHKNDYTFNEAIVEAIKSVLDKYEIPEKK